MNWFKLSNEADVASPALLLFDERIQSNLELMVSIAGSTKRLRPHVKTHKLGPLIVRQLALGITKFKCATLDEAEMCAKEGAPDVMLAVPCIGPNIVRFVELIKRHPLTHFSTLADDSATIQELNEAAVAGGMMLNVLLDVDCGMHRTGVQPGAHAIALYHEIAICSGLNAAGLHVYDGHLNEPDVALRHQQCEDAFAPVLELQRELEYHGLQVPLLVAGGSPTFPIHAMQPDRECSPGTTVLWDFGYGDKFADLAFQPAAILLTRIISKPGPNRLCLDLGHKAVAAENPHPRVRFQELPEATAVIHSEEHLVIETPHAADFQVGDTLHGIPRHICPTVALHSEAVVVREGKAVETWPILARARWERLRR